MWTARSCDSGGPTERIVDQLPEQRTGWLRTPDAGICAEALGVINRTDALLPAWLAERSRERAESVFGRMSMAKEFEMLIETVEMGPAEMWPVKGITLVFAFLVGLALAVVSRWFSWCLASTPWTCFYRIYRTLVVAGDCKVFEPGVLFLGRGVSLTVTSEEGT